MVNYELSIVNYELWIMIMMDDYDLWLWFMIMIMIYDSDFCVWFMILIYDLWFSAGIPIPTPASAWRQSHHIPNTTAGYSVGYIAPLDK